jgi:two-component system invasion response regulator UvrY
MSFPLRRAPLPGTRVLLADDNALVAARIQKLLEASYDVVGVVSSGEELEAAFETLAPEVIVADIAMPGEGGLVAVRRIQERHPGIPVVLLSVVDASEMIRAMIRLGLLIGVHGYVVKQNVTDELVPAIKAALEGRRYISAAGQRGMA